MNEIISTFGGAITNMIEHIGTAIKSAVDVVLYDTTMVEGVATKTLSTSATVILTFAGISLAIGLVFGAVKLLKRR